MRQIQLHILRYLMFIRELKILQKAALLSFAQKFLPILSTIKHSFARILSELINKN